MYTRKRFVQKYTTQLPNINETYAMAQQKYECTDIFQKKMIFWYLELIIQFIYFRVFNKRDLNE